MKQLRDDQQDALNSLREAVAAGKRRICLQASTGFGKTVLSAALVESALRRNKRILFTVPAIALVDQTVSMFRAQGIYDVGVMQARHQMTDCEQPVQVASVQTLKNREIPKADVVII